MKLDPATIILMSTLMTAAMSVVLFAAQRSFPSSVRGMKDWVWGLVLMVGSSVVFGLRGTAAPEIVLPLANSVLLWGLGLLLIGTEKFYGVKPSWRLFHAVWLLGLVVMARWLYVTPDFSMRVALFSFLTLALNFAQFLVIVRHGERHLSTGFFAALVLLQVVVMLHRGVMAFQSDVGFDMLHGGPYHALYLVSATVMTLLLPVGFMTVATRRLQIVLEQRSNHDPLTGVLNRRGFAEVHARETARVRRGQRAMAVMSIDLDYFKAINDNHGHETGDRVLVHVAGVIGAALRESDYVARFGGEEFIVLLSDTDPGHACLVAERIQACLRQPRADDLPAYTVSIGIACQGRFDEEVDGLLRRADVALYSAKANGRDRVEMARETALALAG